MRRPVAVPLEHRHKLATRSGRRRVTGHRAKHTGARPNPNARNELGGISRKLRVRRSERVNKLVEVEQLLDFGTRQDEHRRGRYLVGIDLTAQLLIKRSSGRDCPQKDEPGSLACLSRCAPRSVRSK